MLHHSTMGRALSRLLLVASVFGDVQEGLFGADIRDSQSTPDGHRPFDVRLTVVNRSAFAGMVLLNARDYASVAIPPCELATPLIDLRRGDGQSMQAPVVLVGRDAVPSMPVAQTVGLSVLQPRRETFAGPQCPLEPAQRVLSSTPMAAVVLSPGTLPRALRLSSQVALVSPPHALSRLECCELTATRQPDPAKATGVVETSVPQMPQSVSGPVLLAVGPVAVPMPAPVETVPPKDRWLGSGRPFAQVVLDLHRHLCDASVIDDLLMANYRKQIQGLSAAGNRSALAEKAMHILSVVSTSEARRYAFEQLMAATGGAQSGEVKKSIAAFLGSFPEDSRLRPQAVLFAASWCYEREDYALALENVGQLKVLAQGNPDLVAGALLTEGLCQVRLDQNTQALATLGTIVKSYRQTDVAPKAQFLVGWIHLFNQEPQRARAALQQVVKEYPNTEYASRAQRLLDGL